MALEPDTSDGGDCECSEGAPAWMATFSDLATLLLTFFVLLLSFAEMDANRFKIMAGSMKDAFGIQHDRPGLFEARNTVPFEVITHEHESAGLSKQQRKALERLKKYIADHELEDDIAVDTSDRGMLLRLKDSLTFAPGGAEIRPEALPVLAEIRHLLDTFPSGLSVEGHTDDRPIRNGRYPSNWELSSARAVAVLRGIEGGKKLAVPKLSVVGHADRVPLVPNDSPEHRAMNRRVELVFGEAAPSEQVISKNRTTPTATGAGPKAGTPRDDVSETRAKPRFKPGR